MIVDLIGNFLSSPIGLCITGFLLVALVGFIIYSVGGCYGRKQ